jgi:3-oxoacyl-[acyl-carrier-protein] synthase-1
MSLYLTALGVVCALGRGKQEVSQRLFSAPRSGIVQRNDLFGDCSFWVGAVSDPLPELPSHLRNFDCRNNRLAFMAVSEILAPLESARRRYGADRIGIVLGTSTSGIAEGEGALAHRLATGEWPADFAYSQQEPGGLSEFVAALLGLGGPAYTVHTACSSSGKAIAAAERLIRSGFCDAVVTGGADSICGLTLGGFRSLEALSLEPCNPFSLNRRGTTIGEGAALFLLEPSRAPVALLGAGESSDAHHISAPEPFGKGAMLSMERALHSAGLSPEDIAYINLHGTATPLNDIAEGRAVAQLFGRDVPCSSTKALTGHALGAAAAIEAAFLWLSLDPQFSSGRLPPHVWDGVPDPEIPPIRLVDWKDSPRSSEPRAMLSNSFAFGGSNVSLILGHE